jgi:hypothetical protein
MQVVFNFFFYKENGNGWREEKEKEKMSKKV